MKLTNAVIYAKQLERIIVCLRLSGDRESVQIADDLENAWTSDPEVKYFQNLVDDRGKEGELEFDQPAPVSLSEDHGAYVAAWVWIRDERPEIEHPEDNGDLA
jgi:hypothetical protein